MKVTSPRIIVIQHESLKPERFTDPRKAAEHWAKFKEQEWVDKMKDHPQYKNSRGITTNTLYDDGRIRYRKLKRRALRVFRRIMEVNS